jgi:flagellar hook-length control protein FliK
MNAPFMLLSSAKAGGGSPLGVLVPRNVAANGSSAASGDAAFANSLIQAMLGSNSSAASAQSNMLATDLLAKLVADGSAGSDSQLGDMLSRLLAGIGIPTDTEGHPNGSASQSQFINALVSSLLSQLAPSESTQESSAPTGLTDNSRQTGDLLTQWLEGLNDDSQLDRHQDALNDMMAMLELAQAIVQQWQQPDPLQSNMESMTDTVELQNGNDSAPGGKQAELLRTLRQLTDLLHKNPEQREIAQVVEAFEQLIAPMIKDDGAKSANGSAQVQVQAQSAENRTLTGTVAPVATEHQSLKHKQPVNAVHIPNGQQLAIAAEIMSRGTDLKGRLEALAAKAVVQPQIAAVQATDVPAVAENVRDSEPVGEAGNANPLQMNHLFRDSAATHQAVQPKEQFVHADRFADEMAQVFKNMKVHTANGLSEVRIMLQPEHLGHVDVKVSMQNGQIIAQFMADSVHGKEMLESQLSQLRSVLQSQGLQVDRLEVIHYEPQYSGTFQDSRQQQQSRQSDRNNNEKSTDSEQTPVDFLSELERMAGTKAPGGDKSFDVTA